MTLDLEGDGDLDVVVRHDTNQLSFLVNQGDGSFKRRVLTVGGALLAVLSADVDGDGDPDLVGFEYDEANVLTLLNQGGLVFTERREPLSVLVKEAALGDFDGDGLIDLAAYGGGTLALFPGNGDGTFGNALFTTNLVQSVYDMSSGDVDQDGNQDLVLGQYGIPGIVTLPGNGDGTFLPGVETLEPAFGGIYELELADLNQDGSPDLFALSRYFHVVGLGTGTGTFSLASQQSGVAFGSSVALADITGDGVVDAVTDKGGEFSLFEGRVSGSMGAPRTIAQHLGLDMPVAGDFDGDGDVDIGGLRGTQTPRAFVVSENLGSGRFTVQQRLPTSAFLSSQLAAGDLNNDGLDDVVVASHSSGVGVFLANPTGLSGPVHYAANSPNQVLLGDKDGDGLLDIFAQEGRGVVLLRGLGGGTFGAPLPISGTDSLGSRHPSLALADMNNDGIPDLVSGNTVTNPGRVDIQLGNSALTFTGPTSYRVTLSQPVGIEVADLNADGALDVVAFNTRLTQSLDVFLGYGDGSLAAPIAYDVPVPRSVAIGDLDHDSHMDIVTAHRDGGFHILFGGGGGSFTGPVFHNLGGKSSQRIRLADMNADGHLDVLVSHEMARWAVSLSLGRGDGTFHSATRFAAGELGDGFDLGDTDGDGRTDLIVLDRDLPELLLLPNQTTSH